MKFGFALASVVVVLTGCMSPQYHGTANNFNPTLGDMRNLSMDSVFYLSEAGAKFAKDSGNDALIAAAQESVKYQLKDPDSAKFRNVQTKEFMSGIVVCGEVNSKNSYGGYVGFKRFVAGPETAIFVETDDRPGRQDFVDAANTGINAACS